MMWTPCPDGGGPMPRPRALSTLVAVGAAIALVAVGPVTTSAVADSPQLFVYRVPAGSQAAAQHLFDAVFDVLENRSGGNLYVLGDTATGTRLRAKGFKPTVAEKLAPTGWKAPSTRLVPDAAA